MPSKGRKVDPQQLESAGGFVRDVPKDRLQAPLAALKQIQITSADFGVKHGGSFAQYKAGIEKHGKVVDSYLKASEDYGNNLSVASKKYSTNEADSTAAVKKSGSK